MNAINTHHWGDSLRSALPWRGRAGRQRTPKGQPELHPMRYLDDARMARELWHL